MREVELVLHGARVGTIYRELHRGVERISFRHDARWLASPGAFALDPELYLDERTCAPARGGIFGAFADSAPDRWGRMLLQRKERRSAEAEKRSPRTLSELDYVLGVSDVSRQGALRFRAGGAFVSASDGVPPLMRLRALLEAAKRVEASQELEADLALILDPGSSLGGARPKASIVDLDGALSIAKFPREREDYSIERWEMVAFELALAAGIAVAKSRLERVGDDVVFLTQRFDRREAARIPYASAATLLGVREGERASYPELADLLQREGSRAKSDVEQLFRRMAFNVCIANVDDHLKNHGFLHERTGWSLSPAFDLNPVPAEVRPRILSTNISLDDATGSLELVREVAPLFDLSRSAAEAILRAVLAAVGSWRSVAQKHGASATECQRMQSAFLVS
jgi:serine/threonine-protein kinase HipA